MKDCNGFKIIGVDHGFGNTKKSPYRLYQPKNRKTRACWTIWSCLDDVIVTSFFLCFDNE